MGSTPGREDICVCDTRSIPVSSNTFCYEELASDICEFLAGISDVDAYIDDIVIYSDKWKEHIETIKRVFQRLKSAKLVINLSKSDFGKAEVKYLVHIVDYGKTTPTEAKTCDILTYPTPKNIKRFWEMAGYYRKFCKDFSRTAHLTVLIKKGNRFRWTDEFQKAFEDIKKTLGSKPVLRAPNYGQPFCLAVGIGLVLMQLDESNQLRPISYFSKNAVEM